MRRATYVFGYGSLVTVGGRRPSRDPDGQDPDRYVTDLLGMRRTWGVAMDNTCTIPGYKYYVDRATGERLELSVAFLDLVEHSTIAVNGLCFRIEPDELSALDERERNYARIDVTDRVALPLGRVWTYLGSEAGRQRFDTGKKNGWAAIERGYRDAVEEGFRRLGTDEHARYVASTEPAELPVLDLKRIDLSAP
ncbi:MAG: gamma-glutamylcyclotransferase family protein [Solirubrobacterales bacterium]